MLKQRPDYAPIKALWAALTDDKNPDAALAIISSCGIERRAAEADGLIRNSKGFTLNVSLGGATPLMVAALASRVDVLAALISSGANVHAIEDEYHRDALHVAIAVGSVEACRLLLEAKANVHHQAKSGDTALHRAASYGSLDIIELLISAGANANALNTTRRTPLYHSAMNGLLSTCELLISKGATVNVHDSALETPLSLAAFHGHDAVVKLLARHKANALTVNSAGITPLHGAIANNKLASAKLLLAMEFDATALDGDGNSLLLVALRERFPNDVVEHIISKGAPVGTANRYGRTPLHEAATMAAAIPERLISLGANVNVIDNNNRAPLLHAIQNTNAPVACLLIRAGSWVNGPAQATSTALAQACLFVPSRSMPIINCLLEHGASVNTNTSDMSPLHVAADRCYTDILRRLLDAGADIDALTSDGDTALHNVASLCDVDSIRLLTAEGADVRSSNRLAMSPLALADRYLKQKMVNAARLSDSTNARHGECRRLLTYKGK